MWAVRAAGVWAWTGARKNIAFHGRGGGGGGASASGGGGESVWAVWAAGVTHGLEPVKHCFSWPGAGGGGASASGGGGSGMDWEPVLEPLKHCFSWPGRGYRSSEGGAMGLH